MCLKYYYDLNIKSHNHTQYSLNGSWNINTRDQTPPENNEHTQAPRVISYLEIIAQLKQRKQKMRQIRVRTKHGPGVHGPLLWTESMDPCHGPGPWTLFSK